MTSEDRSKRKKAGRYYRWPGMHNSYGRRRVHYFGEEKGGQKKKRTYGEGMEGSRFWRGMECSGFLSGSRKGNESLMFCCVTFIVSSRKSQTLP